MKKRLNPHFLFVMGFLAILYGGLIVFCIKPKAETSYIENRILESSPTPTWNTILDGNYFKGWSEYYLDHAPGRNTLLRFDTFLNLHILQRPVVNNVVVSNEYLLAFNADERFQSDAIYTASQAMSAQFKALNKLVTSYGGTFLYVAIPGQTAYFSDQYPWYLSNRQSRELLERDTFLSDLSVANVPTLDVGDLYESLGHPQSFYSNTDYHYTYFGAFTAYQAIMTRINQLADLNLKILQVDDVEFKTLENIYLGSRLRKLHGQWPNSEHPVIGILKDPIPFERYEHESPVSPTCYSLPKNTWQAVDYTVYMGGDRAETQLCTNRSTLPNLLVFGDSFTNPLETLLYASFNETRSLDLRHYTDMNLSDYIAKYKPEVVICVRDYQALLDFNGNGTLN